MVKTLRTYHCNPHCNGYWTKPRLFGRFQIFVKMTDLETNLQWMWPKEKFINRKYVMQEMFENYTEGDEWQLPTVSLLVNHISQLVNDISLLVNHTSQLVNH